jgi:hypothetical protein
MKSKLVVSALGMAFAAIFCTAQGNAATITDDFSFTDSSNAVVASGSFSYDSSHSGQLSYGDLSSFSITLAGHQYDLSFVNSVSNYVYFGYDTTSNSFVPASVPGSVGNYPGILSAINASLNQGFFFDPLASMSGPGNDGLFTEYASATTLTATSYSISQTPIPAALPLFASALGGLGFLGFRRKKQADVQLG